MKKVLITGGAGFIGYHLAKLLTLSDYEIVIADNFFRSEYDTDLKTLLENPKVRLIKADLTDPASWDAIGNNFDYVYHLASINGTELFYKIPHEVLRIGVLSTINVLEWFRAKNNKQGAKILFTSSNEAYSGALEAFGKLPLPTPENVPLVIADTYNPRWSYGGQKLIGELFFIHYSKAYNFRMSIVRPHNFYGPREGYHHAIPEIIERIKAKTDPFPIFGSDETRSFCYIDDAVEAIRRVMESEKTDGGTYHIGSNEETLIADLVERIFTLMNWRPTALDKKSSPAGSVKRRLADVSKIKRDTGWESKVSLEQGLKEMIAWYTAHPRPQKD
jgi:UDP-glucose 4-epimerase/UDP-glucuronate decarboxylase